MYGFTIENSALVLVDHQVGTINWTGALDPAQRAEIAVWTLFWARFAKLAGMPVVLTSSMEDQEQGVLLPSLQEILPEAYAKRIKRVGVINAWDDSAFSQAVRATGKKHLIMAGLTTEVCLVPPVLSALKEGFKVATLLDASGGNTRLGEAYADRVLSQAGALLITTLPLVSSMLGDWSNPAAGAFFAASEQSDIFGLQTRGNVR